MRVRVRVTSKRASGGGAGGERGRRERGKWCGRQKGGAGRERKRMRDGEECLRRIGERCGRLHRDELLRNGAEQILELLCRARHPTSQPGVHVCTGVNSKGVKSGGVHSSGVMSSGVNGIGVSSRGMNSTGVNGREGV